MHFEGVAKTRGWRQPVPLTHKIRSAPTRACRFSSEAPPAPSLMDAVIDADTSLLSPRYLLQNAAAATVAAGLYGAPSMWGMTTTTTTTSSATATSSAAGADSPSADAHRSPALPAAPPPVTARMVEKAGRRVASRRGPHNIGIGWISTLAMKAAAVCLVQAALAVVLYWIAVNPYALTFTGTAVMVAFATNPSETSFLEWSRRQAPHVAAQKQGLDALRTRLAPYLLRFQDWEYFDFGMCSVVRLRDFADYVYLYLGVFNRWYLTGWYLDAPETDVRWEELRLGSGNASESEA